MTNLAGRVRRVLVLSFAGVAALAAGGCTSADDVGGGQPQVVSSQPRVATYRCGADGEIRVVNTGASVLVSEEALTETEEAEESVGSGLPAPTRFELVAAPPNQRSRYGGEGLALVLEGREALWMKAGTPPLTCTR